MVLAGGLAMWAAASKAFVISFTVMRMTSRCTRIPSQFTYSSLVARNLYSGLYPLLLLVFGRWIAPVVEFCGSWLLVQVIDPG